MFRIQVYGGKWQQEIGQEITRLELPAGLQLSKAFGNRSKTLAVVSGQLLKVYSTRVTWLDLYFSRSHQSCSQPKDQRWGYQLGCYENMFRGQHFDEGSGCRDLERQPIAGRGRWGTDRHQPQAWHSFDMETQGGCFFTSYALFKIVCCFFAQ